MKCKTVCLNVVWLSLIFQMAPFAREFSNKNESVEIMENQWAMKFVKISAGNFKMGLNDYVSALMEVPEPKENELKDELPQHQVKITHDFYMGQTEITQQQWLGIMQNKPGPKKFWKQSNWKTLPVVSVSWFMAARFTEEINKLDKHYRYRLATEAEWEYVARAGSGEFRPVAIENLEDYAWFINNSGDVQQPVASKKPNAFGVYDMLGNVWEWVDDWYAPDAYAAKGRSNPVGPKKGISKVRRGGSYHCQVHLIRPGYRAANKPEVAYEVSGFRVVAEKR
jgi:formylglycine-generating enzyme required for sulfatase activity